MDNFEDLILASKNRSFELFTTNFKIDKSKFGQELTSFGTL